MDYYSLVSSMSWSYWVIFGLGLLVFEILTPGGFFTFFFGVSAFVVAALVWLGVLQSGSGQWLVFAILGIGLLVVLRPAVRKRFETNTPKVDQLVGETAIALEDLDENGRGKVELRGTSWSALYSGSDRILKGDRLRVTKVDGLSLKVERE
ncbi:MAG: NfeD family protein [Vicinamibacteria bacterium]|nr:NfeD family protein [Vicinamibacteria bacterium]